MSNESFYGIAARNQSPSPSYIPDQRNEVQVITGNTFEDCQQKLYTTYGRNYTILGKRPQTKPGFLGFGKKEYWEVRYSVGSVSQISQMTAQDSFQKNRDEILAKTSSNSSSAVTNTLQIANLDKKVEEFQKSMAKKLEEIAAATNAGDKPVSIQKIEELLQDNEFTFSYINKITTRLRSELSVEELEDFSLVQEKVVDWIGESIQIQPKEIHKYPHVIILLGPTGVGKTTTIAKLAGTMILNAKNANEELPKIHLITTDITRVGALEQIQRYADMLEVKVDKAESAKDVKDIFDQRKANTDIFFIDTPGYSPNDSENIGKMRKMLEIRGIHPDVYLTFMATSKAKDIINTLQNFEPFNYSSIIITKWDETSAVGNVISVLSEKGKAVSYITDGQRVPIKIERATKLKFLLNLNDFEINREHIDEKFAEEK